MIAIAFTPARHSPDEAVKQAAAVEQMDQLMARLAGKEKYHTLSLADRNMLTKQGYADELVDNLVYTTQRIAEHGGGKHGNGEQGYRDELVIGFTYAAFDPSLYAGATLQAQLKQSHQGCCCYCETFLAATDSGVISHFRPVYNLDPQRDGQCDGRRSPYFALAYEQNNLLYSCRACSESYKGDCFPLRGQRFPAVTIGQEQPLLISPYVDDPRAFIRFNPRNGHAYAFDRVRAFYQATQRLSDSEVERLLWQDPDNIPLLADRQPQGLTHSPPDLAYRRWLAALPDDDPNKTASRGEVSIALLGLNRQALVLSRCAMLNQLKLAFTAFMAQGAKAPEQLSLEDMASHQYRSLSIDAFNSWLSQQQVQQQTQPEAKPEADPEQQRPAATDEQQDNSDDKTPVTGTAITTATTTTAIRPEQTRGSVAANGHQSGEQASLKGGIPSWFRSCVMYLVTESELQQVNKRRLVCLSASDGCYGGDLPQKCVFLAVDWQGDHGNVINVHSNRNIWQTSFAELSRTRPLDLSKLFANNEVWAEGNYPALVAS